MTCGSSHAASTCPVLLTVPNGEMVYLWRAVDQEGEVLESFVTRTRDKAAALTFMKKALKRHGSPEAITTDGLRSYKAAISELGCEAKQEIGRWANNRVENSHLPFRRQRASDAALQTNEDATEVRFGSRQRPQPLQRRTTPDQPRDLQSPPLGCLGQVAEPRGLKLAGEGEGCVSRRAVRIGLTAPRAHLILKELSFHLRAAQEPTCRVHDW